MNQLVKILLSSLLMVLSLAVWMIAVIGGAMMRLLYSEWWHALSIAIGFILSSLLLHLSWKCLFYYEPWLFLKSKILILYNKFRGMIWNQ